MNALNAVTLAPAKAASRPVDPSRLVQRAWASFRLPLLQELVRIVIAELQLSPRPSSAPGASSELLVSEQDPVAEALQACCDELRDASGMAGAEEELARRCGSIRQYTERAPGGWSEAFTVALAAYRRAAAEALQNAFAQAPSR